MSNADEPVVIDPGPLFCVECGDRRANWFAPPSDFEVDDWRPRSEAEWRGVERGRFFCDECADFHRLDPEPCFGEMVRILHPGDDEY